MRLYGKPSHVSHFTFSFVPNHNGLQQCAEIRAYGFIEKQEVESHLLSFVKNVTLQENIIKNILGHNERNKRRGGREREREREQYNLWVLNGDKKLLPCI